MTINGSTSSSTGSRSSNASVPLNHLPLQQSTFITLQRRGFVTVGELEQSLNHGGMEHLAQELNVPIPNAQDLFQQVQNCLYGSTTTTTTSSSSSSSSGATDSPTTTDDNTINTTSTTTATTTRPLLSARELLNQKNKIHKHNQFIVTFCQQIDLLLGGGIALGDVTELIGLPGVGKTQLAMQLCVDTHIPKIHGGVQGQAIYIDTEGNFHPQRCHTMAQALVRHIQGSIQRQQRQHHHQQQRQQQLPNHFTPESILKGIHVYRVHNEQEQTATIYSLPHLIQQQLQLSQQDPTRISPIKLIVIDSIAFHYRSPPTPTPAAGEEDEEDEVASNKDNDDDVVDDDNLYKNTSSSSYNTNKKKTTKKHQHIHHQESSKTYYIQRTKALTTLAAFLGELATTYDIAIVAINHMTTKFAGDGNTTSASQAYDAPTTNDSPPELFMSTFVPALGESWAHATSTRLVLSQQQQQLQSSTASTNHTNSAATTTYNNANNNTKNKGGSSNNRICTLVKSPHQPSGTAMFQIVKNGIRDVSERDKQRHHHHHQQQSQQQPQIQTQTRSEQQKTRDMQQQPQQQHPSRIVPPPPPPPPLPQLSQQQQQQQQHYQLQSLPPPLPRSVTPAQDPRGGSVLATVTTPTPPSIITNVSVTPTPHRVGRGDKEGQEEGPVLMTTGPSKRIRTNYC